MKKYRKDISEIDKLYNELSDFIKNTEKKWINEGLTFPLEGRVLSFKPYGPKAKMTIFYKDRPLIEHKILDRIEGAKLIPDFYHDLNLTMQDIKNSINNLINGAKK